MSCSTTELKRQIGECLTRHLSSRGYYARLKIRGKDKAKRGQGTKDRSDHIVSLRGRQSRGKIPRAARGPENARAIPLPSRAGIPRTSWSIPAPGRAAPVEFR